MVVSFRKAISQRRCRRIADPVSYGGDVTVVHLSEAGLKGNMHFRFSDLNNIAVADPISEWLKEKGFG